MFYEQGKKYKKAYEFWQKALDFAQRQPTKINIAYRMLEIVSKMRLPMREKAQEIMRVCNILQKLSVSDRTQAAIKAIKDNII